MIILQDSLFSQTWLCHALADKAPPHTKEVNSISLFLTKRLTLPVVRCSDRYVFVPLADMALQSGMTQSVAS